jgi:ribonucleotide reductase beta subunit family protein with ferritin-like domain
MSSNQLLEPLLQNTSNKYVSLPIQYPGIERFYNLHVDAIWFVNEIDLANDMRDFVKLSPDAQYFIKHVLAFFAASDGIIMENIFANFAQEIQVSEVRSFYAIQMFMEDIHNRSYSKLITTYASDKEEQNKLFNAIETMPAISKKARWAERWISSDASFAKRLFAFAIVEGLFFSGAFCAIFWIKEMNIMHGLTFSNEFIARDEALHVEFAIYLYVNFIVNKLSQEEVTILITEAVNIEKEFINTALPCSLLGMNAEMMSEYIEFVANRLMTQFGYTSPYSAAKCPFGFMNKIALQNQTNFFDRQVSEYKKNTTHIKADINFDEEF